MSASDPRQPASKPPAPAAMRSGESEPEPRSGDRAPAAPGESRDGSLAAESRAGEHARDERAHAVAEAPHRGPGGRGRAAARKLGRWKVAPVPAPPEGEAHDEDQRDVVAHASRIVLALGALGIVYGDLGTSPLYTEQVIFTAHADAARPTPAGIYGIVSLIFWSMTIVVSVKYAGFIMRAHNRGDGGIMALAALVQRRAVVGASVLIVLGIFGAGLFFGDAMVTPAISVLSAVEGLEVVEPTLSHVVVPIALVILIALFVVQRFGTGRVGWVFGPVLFIWFVVIAVLGLREVIPHLSVLQGLSPTWGVRFIVDHGGAAFLTLGSVVLCLTGAEALYADRGHFGAGPIRFTWFSLVFPAVMLNYLGQAALIQSHPASIRNPFYLLVPSAFQLVMVVLATVATVIASQAAITGSFSVARQALQLGFLPRLNIRHTSELEGQIYVPVLNWIVAAGVIALVVGFRHSNKLAEIYGVAVTGTFVLNTILFLAIARSLWQTPIWRLALLGTLFLTVEVAFFTANLTKISHGAWLPLGVGVVVAFTMITWRRGRDIVTRNREAEEGRLSDFLDHLHRSEPPIHRVPGTAVFMNPGSKTTPLALRMEVERIHALHEHVVIASLDYATVPHVERGRRISVKSLGEDPFQITYVTVKTGYRERLDVPAALMQARDRGLLDGDLDLERAAYFVSRMTIMPTRAPGMARWRKRLFIAMARNAASPIDSFKLPPSRTVMLGTQVGF